MIVRGSHLGIQNFLKVTEVNSLEDPRISEGKRDILEALCTVIQDKLKETLLNFDSNMEQLTEDLHLGNGMLELSKTPKQIEEIWKGNLSEFQKRVNSIISESKHLSEEDKKDTIKALNAVFLGFSRQTNSMIKQNIELIENYLKKPQDMSYILDIKPLSESLKTSDSKTLAMLEDILKKVEKIQMNVDCLRDQKALGNNLILRLEKFKEDVFKETVEIREAVATTIRDNLSDDLRGIDTFILGSQNTFKKKPQDVKELEELKKEYTIVMKKFQQMDTEIKGLDKKIKIMNDYGFKTSGQINLATIRRKWDGFAMKISGFTFTLNNAENAIRKRVKSEIEKMSGEIDKFYIRIQSIDLSSTDNMTKEQEMEFSSKLKDIRKEWEDIQKALGPAFNEAETYNVDLSDLKSLQAVRDYFKGPFAEWMIYFEFLSGVEGMEKEDWISFKYRVYDFQKYVLEWEEKTRGKRDPSSKFIYDQCMLYKDIWPALKCMIGEGFQRSHWTELFLLLTLPKHRPFNEVTFGEILSKKDIIHKKIDEIKFLAARAQGEIALREALADLQSWSETTTFIFFDYIDQEKVTLQLVKEWTDILTEVGDNQVILQNIKDSKFSQNFTDQIELFETRLGGLDEYLLKLNQIQRKWAYLEPVFGRGALPSEQGRFRRIDDEFRGIIGALNKEPTVVTLALIPNISDTLDMLIDQLERCQKALNSYLEEKRNLFPRFYFLGDDDLLELLGQSTNVEVIHSHLRKLFSGIVKLKLEEGESQAVLQIISGKGESVKLQEKVVLTKDVEIWLAQLTESMFKAISNLLSSCVAESDVAGTVPKFPGQVLEITEAIIFTERTAKALSSDQKDGLSQVKKEYSDRLAQFTMNKAKMTGLDQLKVKNLILDVIHDIVVIDELIEADIRTVDDWVWFKQLKYHVSRTKDVIVGMAKAEFNYTYEYQGNVSKLVHTPLTDKCYLTLTQGMMMGYGGNPYGPAGTGKTESVKALGYAFGRQVLVFNCDEGIDYQSMGRIFIGLVKCGAWGCFDEFNRLLEDQLSAISQQIQVIQYAIKEGIPKIEMLGQETSVSSEAGIFVTMNPAGKGYGGRSKLPDNLKQLFRPVAMSKPDNEMISEFLLFSEGYISAKKLAKKVVTVFTLSKQLLSSQQHYDWGLRALKTILVVAGQLLQLEFEKDEKITEQKESELLIKAIRVNTMSKLTFGDAKKFDGLMSNIFMGIKIDDVKYEDLTKAIGETLKESNLTYVERQVNKIKQFYEAVKQRMGVVLVGPSGCSKTTIWRVLRTALKKLGQEVKVHILNPKSVSRTELLGNMNNETREFVDGILTGLARKVVKEPMNIMSWIICDGDVDPEWIESLNSVLDDNHLLTLPNGERIALGSNVNFIFETHDLEFASPATVSRMGMIYLNNEDINIESIVTSWMTSLPTLTANYLQDRLKNDMDSILKVLISQESHSIVESTRVGLLNNLLSHLVASTNDQEYALGLYRGLSASVKSEKRESISSEVEKITGVKLSEDNLLVDFEGSDNRTSALDKYLPTQESRLILGYLRPWIKNNEPFIIAGPEGCGKEAIVKAGFMELAEKVRFATVYCNSQLTSKQLLLKIYEHTLKSTVASGKIIKPKDCTRLVIFIKDVNLPKPDKYHTTEVVSLLQQILTHHGFYDENMEFVSIDKRIQIVATLNPIISFGRYKLSTRFTANVRLMSIDNPSKKELGKIYHSMLKSFSAEQGLSLTPDTLKRSAVFLTEVYEHTLKSFLPQKNIHYIFTPRETARAIEAIKHYSIQDDRSFLDVLQTVVIETLGNKMASVDDAYNFLCAVVERATSILETGMIDESTVYTRIGNSDGKIKPTSRASLEKILKQELISYEKNHEELILNFNDEVIDMVTKFEHILGAGGHILAVGTSGHGRRILIKYTSHLLGLEFKTFFPTRIYKLREFKKDMRRALELAGISNKPSVLLLEDHHFEDVQNLDLVNTFLSSGDVQGMIKQEEIEQLLGKDGVEELMKNNLGNNVLDAFVNRVRSNLRIVVSLDCTSENFVNQISFNPALLKVCNIVWAREWKIESKTKFLDMELYKMKGTKDLVDDQYFKKVFLQIHLKSNKPLLYFFNYIKCFEKIYSKKVGSVGDQHKRLVDGLQKITEANQEVDVITKQAEVMRVELGIKQKEADEALNTITKAVEEASKSKSEAEQLKKFLVEEEGKTKDSKLQVESELSKVEPIIAEAKKGIRSINKSHINELKAYTMCPDEVNVVFNALFILMGEGDLTWGSIKNALKNPSFMDSVVSFDARRITEKDRLKVEGIIKKESGAFDQQRIYKVSMAAGPISMYVNALCKLSKVLHQIKPLEDELAAVDKKLSSYRGRLVECENTVATLDQKVKEYKEQFSKKTQEAAQLKEKLENVEDTLERAKGLLEKLSDEKERWKKQAEDISAEINNMSYNCLLSSAFCIYLSEEEESKRETHVAYWKKISKNETFNFCTFNFSESQFLKWKSNGHPSDQLSLENTTIYYNTNKPSLVVDPSGRIESWLAKAQEGNKNFEMLMSSDEKLMTQLDLAIRFGKTILISEVASIDSFYLSLLRADLQRQGGRLVVMIGEKSIDYNSDFSILFTTRDTTISLHPKTKATLSVINYSVTKSGLEMQLLSTIINYEKPELEEKKIKILEQEDAFKMQLAEVENQLLYELATSTGNLLENKKLIMSLEEAKSKSETITENLKNSKKITE
jgi:dynein heavy chain 2